MTLGELIEWLEAAPDMAVENGLGHPHSYRGYYEDLAFELIGPTTTGEMLAAAKGAIGREFEGYKGGAYRMWHHTTVWVAQYGDCGEGLGPLLLNYMLSSQDDAEIRRRAECYPALLAACERLVFADELGAVYERHFAMEQAKAAIRAAKPPDKEPT